MPALLQTHSARARRTLPALLLAGLCSLAHAQTANAPPPRPTLAPDLRAAPPGGSALAQRIAETGRRGLLFEAVRGSQKVFLYGSTLYGKADYFALNRPLMQALGQSSRLLVEHDVTQPEAANQFALELGTLPPGDSLERHIPAELAARLYPEAARWGLQPGQINRYKPWVVSAMLAHAHLTGNGYAAGENTTYYLVGYARARNLPVTPLEGNHSQTQLINSQDDASQADQLNQTVKALISGQATRQARLYIDQGWAQGDASAVSQFIATEQGTAGPWAAFYTQSWLAGRSQQLAAGIEADLARPGSPLVAISAANLVGPTGVMALLAGRGFTLRDLQAP